MDEDAKKKAQEIFDKLPQDIKEVIFSDDYQTILIDIGKKYNFTPEQQGKFEFETTMVLMNVNKRPYYQFNLESELDLDEDTAQKISTEISDTIFAEVWESLDKLDAADIGNEEDLNKKLDYEEKKLDKEENTEGAKEQASVISSPIAITSLATLSDRLKQASIATPTKRDYSLVKNSSVSSDPSSSASDAAAGDVKPAIDPYHESIGE